MCRFAVEQGRKPNGEVKLRAVDNMSWAFCARGRSRKRARENSVNGFCALPEKVHHNHIDDLAAGMAKFLLLLGTLPGLFKADISAAFRRIPLKPAHRWAAGVAYKAGDVVWVSWHRACMFGATSSVYNWERLGALLATILIRVLKICLFRYVDDLFAPERPESMQHAMYCVARMLRLMLGEAAVEDSKLEYGQTLVVLGVRCLLAEARLYLLPAREKAAKCLFTIRTALAEGLLRGGCAQKLAGRLSWAQTYMFHKLGRAMMRPIFDQRWSWNGSIGKALRIALVWWSRVLELDICERKPCHTDEREPVHVFVDARGVPPRCAAVAFIDGVCHFSDGQPSDAIMARFDERADAQICGLKMLDVALGLSVSATELKARKCILHVDNTGAEVCAL